MTAIRATFSTYRHVPTRKVIQLVLEVPEEHQQAVFAALGYPLTGTEHWVAVVRLTNPVDPPPARPPAERRDPQRDDPEPPSSDLPEGVNIAKSQRAKAWFAALPEEEKIVASAAMLAKDEAFQGWFMVASEEEATQSIRIYCGVKSRRDLATNYRARVLFNSLVADFQAAVGRMAEARR